MIETGKRSILNPPKVLVAMVKEAKTFSAVHAYWARNWGSKYDRVYRRAMSPGKWANSQSNAGKPE